MMQIDMNVAECAAWREEDRIKLQLRARLFVTDIGHKQAAEYGIQFCMASPRIGDPVRFFGDYITENVLIGLAGKVPEIGRRKEEFLALARANIIANIANAVNFPADKAPVVAETKKMRRR